LAGNPRRLGAELGMLGVLHTWSRTLIYHPHVHYLVPGGGLSPDQRRWVAARHGFLLPVKPLGARYRTVFKERLQKQHPDLYKEVPAQVWKRHWNVDSRPAGSGENALRYLSRYVFKTATSNRLVQRLPGGKVRWSYRESNTGSHRAMDLEPLDFVSRFLQHILPRGFARVRTFGWLHPAAKVRANRVRALLREKPLLTAAEHQAWNLPREPDAPRPAENTSAPGAAPLCPRCRKVMFLVGEWKGAAVTIYPKRPP